MTPEKFIENYQKALASKNWKEVAPLIHPDACITFSTGSIHKGIGEIRKAFERNFSIIKQEKYQMSDHKWLKKDELMAVYVFVFNWKGFVNGEIIKKEGRGTAVIVNENGNWVLLTEHLGSKN